MNTEKISQALQSLFKHYVAAFEQFNVAQAMSCYRSPCSLSTPDNLKVLNDEVQLKAEFEDIFSQLKGLGFKKVIAEKASYSKVTDELTLVNVLWQFFDENNQMFTDFTALYHVAGQEDDLSIVNVISHEAQQYTPLAITLENF